MSPSPIRAHEMSARERLSRAISEGNIQDFVSLLGQMDHFPEDLPHLVQATSWAFDEFIVRSLAANATTGEDDEDELAELRRRTHEKQDEILLPLMASLDPAWGPGAEYILRQLINEDRHDLIPQLHARHFYLPATAMNQQVIARSLARGAWPHPNLIMPDVLAGSSTRKKFLETLDDHLRSNTPCLFFTQLHAERLCALHLPQRHSFRRLMRKSLAWSLSRPIDFAPCAPEALLVFEQAELINLDKFAPHDASKSVRDLVSFAQAEKQRRALDKAALPVRGRIPLPRM